MLNTRYNRIVLPFFFLSDLIGVALTFWLAYYIRFGSILVLSDKSYAILLIVVILTWAIASLLCKSYFVKRTTSLFNNLSSSFFALLIFMFIYILYIMGFKQYGFSRLFHLYFLSLAILLIVASNIIRFYYVLTYRTKGKNVLYSLLLVPASNTIQNYSKMESDLRMIGHQVSHLLQYGKTGMVKKIKTVLTRERINTIFIFNPQAFGEETDNIISIADNYGIRIKLLTYYSTQLGKRLGLDTIGNYALLDLRVEPLLYLHNRIIKRGIDIVMALLSIIFVLSWLPVVVKIAQMMTYPGSLFFRQDRVGRDNNIFSIYKFRTMYHDSENVILAEEGKASKTSVEDTRIPWFGKLLRRTNLDEYPQFINILLGSMSVVGPRPHMKGEDEELAQVIPKYRVRRFVKPGITGWSAVNGYRGGTDDMKLMKKRTDYDIYYLEHWSFWFDIKIVFTTFWQMLTLKTGAH